MERDDSECDRGTILLVVIKGDAKSNQTLGAGFIGRYSAFRPTIILTDFDDRHGAEQFLDGMGHRVESSAILQDQALRVFFETQPDELLARSQELRELLKKAIRMANGVGTAVVATGSRDLANLILNTLRFDTAKNPPADLFRIVMRDGVFVSVTPIVFE